MSTPIETTDRPLRTGLRYVDLLAAGMEALEKAEARILRELGDRQRGLEVVYLGQYDAEHSLRLLSAAAMGGAGELVMEPALRLYAAVEYCLDRVQRDPDLGWVVWHTELHRLMIQGEAAHLRQSEAAVCERRERDLAKQPARVAVAEQRLDIIRDLASGSVYGLTAEEKLARIEKALDCSPEKLRQLEEQGARP